MTTFIQNTETRKQVEITDKDILAIAEHRSDIEDWLFSMRSKTRETETERKYRDILPVLFKLINLTKPKE